MRYLGLDIGQKNIGVAVGESIASELTTIRANNKENFYKPMGLRQALELIDKLISNEAIDGIVVGLPVNQEGELTEEAKKIKDFSQALEQATDKKIHYVNETLTSFMARDILESQGVNADQIDERVDQLAATLILQQYLEENALS